MKEHFVKISVQASSVRCCLCKAAVAPFLSEQLQMYACTVWQTLGATHGNMLCFCKELCMLLPTLPLYVWPYRLQPGSHQAWPPTLSLHNIVHVVQSAPRPSQVCAHKAQAPTSVAWLDHLLILILNAKLRHRGLMAAVAPALAFLVFRSLMTTAKLNALIFNSMAQAR